MDKRLKDPIYGYISIPVEYMKNVIDTAVFQRLRRIMQTSYAPLYSSAIHNRFVHFIGVFHLGRIASGQLEQELLKKGYCEADKLQKYVQIYQIACLLHDVGHAPFSHTGEGFYRTDDYSSKGLHKMLLDAVFEQEQEEKVKFLYDVCPTLKAEGTQEEFYYLYYRSGTEERISSKEVFCRNMYNAAHSLAYIE